MSADQITGELVHVAMRRRGLQQRELAEVLNMTQTAVSRKMLGKRCWTIDELLAVSRWLDTPVTDLLPAREYEPAPGGVRGEVRLKGLEPPTFCSGDTPIYERIRADHDLTTLEAIAALPLYADTERVSARS